MNNLYIITGPAGVGKTTISEKIASQNSKCALIEGDEIYHLVYGGYVSPWKEGNHIEIFWKNSIDLIRNFLNAGYDVVFNYIINKDKEEQLAEIFKDYIVKFVVLMVDENTIIKRDKLRKEECQMKERAVLLLNKMKNYNFNSKYILDTTNLSAEETMSIILREDRFICK